MGSYDGNDRREFPRVMIDLPLEYQMISTSRIHGGLIEDMNEREFRMHCPRELPVGEKLHVTVLFPDRFALNTLDAHAEVIWKDLSCKGDGDGFCYGLRILQMKGEDLSKLRHLIGKGPHIEKAMTFHGGISYESAALMPR